MQHRGDEFHSNALSFPLLLCFTLHPPSLRLHAAPCYCTLLHSNALSFPLLLCFTLHPPSLECTLLPSPTLLHSSPSFTLMHSPSLSYSASLFTLLHSRMLHRIVTPTCSTEVMSFQRIAGMEWRAGMECRNGVPEWIAGIDCRGERTK
jgi:hypothetical protein